MCGIFGLTYKPGARPAASVLRSQVELLFQLSETRGKEAAGIAVLTSEHLDVYKDGLSAGKMLRTERYKNFYRRAENRVRQDGDLAIIGHARLVTNGMQSLDQNNQPVLRDGIVAVHNGIIVNDMALWSSRPGLVRQADVDTEVVPALLRSHLNDGLAIQPALDRMMASLEGEASVAMLLADAGVVVLATNTGSIYTVCSEAQGFVAFLSEQLQAEEFARLIGANDARVDQLEAGATAIVTLADLSIDRRKWSEPHVAPQIAAGLGRMRHVEDSFRRQADLRKTMRRCARCILPETMPFIVFDDDGVCNFCHNHRPIKTHGRDALEQRIASYRAKQGNNCFVALSGGRDSCYGLHLLKKELGLQPIAYTYDWGMVTPLARRNQARMCGALGVEHLWVSADIKSKRANIRRNLLAWLKSPHLGMLPLLMAGDKQFFYYANKISSKMAVDLSVFCMNAYERTDFKTGFAGIPPKAGEGKHYHLGARGKAAVAQFYGLQYLKNPSYLNASMSDTLFAYLSYYFTDQNYLYLFDYIPWEESEVESVLLQEYGFERPHDTQTTWRIGDGTAPFYNYVYYAVAGFTEFDTFRSNQIREGKMTRDDALKKVAIENLPRWDSIREYLEIVNVDFDDAIRAINRMPTLYDR